ncbi:MAG: 4Fe-4S binding protein [Lawsonibacter sp.]|jgi:ferredoxin
MNLYEITFSPTGGTQKAADILTKALEGKNTPVDLTSSDADFSSIAFTPEDIAVIAVPSYAGRVPKVAILRLSTMRGNGARAVLVCVYGNRAYEDTLVELEDTVKQSGFRVIAAVATIAEHSIARQYANGRPDVEDEIQLKTFSDQIQKKISLGDNTQPKIPGNRPYKKVSSTSIIPKATKNCNSCGLCAQKCPVQAIDPSNPKHTNPEVCISCMRCITVCPRSARKINSVVLTTVNAALKKVCSERKVSELYI